MTVQELRDELEWTRPAFEATELDYVLADGHLPVVGDEDAHRHQVVVDEMLRHGPS